MVFLSNYNFYVDTDDVNFLEDLEGIYHSYTFPIYKLNNEESHLIQNMLFSFNTVNNDYDTFIITYSLTENERENLANSIHVDLEGKVSIEFLSDFNPDIILDPLTVIIDVDEGSVTCWEEEYGSSQGTGWEEIVGWDQVTCPWLIDPGTGGGNGAGPTSPGGNTGSNPPGNTGNPNNTSNGPNAIPDNPFTYSNVNTAASQRSKTFYRMQLNQEQRDWLADQPQEIKDAIGDFLESQVNIDGLNSAVTQYPQEDVDFVIDLYNLISLETTIDSNALNFLLKAKSHDKFYSSFDLAFMQSVNLFTDFDSSDSANIDPITIYFTMRVVALRAAHPDWSDLKIYWEVSKDLVHITLDVLGLIPVFGEPADIVNGVIYTFEGDGLNASLSYAGAIPFVGWLSTGSKITIKVLNQTTQGLIGLVWKVSDNGLITFGNRNILKHVIGSAGTGLHAHHVMPWNFGSSPLVQKAANSDFGFNMNEFANGFPLPSTNHLNGHNSIGGYNDTIADILSNYNDDILAMDNNQAYNFLSGFINHIKQLLEANPDLNLGQIADLINYP